MLLSNYPDYGYDDNDDNWGFCDCYQCSGRYYEPEQPNYPDTPFQKYLEKVGACQPARIWADGLTPKQAWDQCTRVDWLNWCYLRAKADSNSNSSLRKIRFVWEEIESAEDFRAQVSWKLIEPHVNKVLGIRS